MLPELRPKVLELHAKECGCGHDDCPRIDEYVKAVEIGARHERKLCIEEAEAQFPCRWPWSTDHPINNDQRHLRCLVPPPGWRCTRVRGHEGPCAAVPATV